MARLEDFGVARHQGRLGSGVKVVLYERKGMPLMMKAAFLSGSIHDPTGKDGLSHFTEHMLVAGTAKYPSKDKLATQIERIGGSFGASTGKEIMNLNFHLAEAEDLPVAVEIMNQMLAASLLSDKLVETERGSIIQEIDMYDSSPPRAISMKLPSVLFANPAARRNILGTQETLTGITRADIKGFFSSILSPSRMTIIASGGLSLDRLIAELEAGLETTPAPEPAKVELKAIPNEQIAVLPFDNNDQINFTFGMRTPGFLNPAAPALSLLGTIMGGGRASVLRRLLRYEKGLVYSVGAGPYLLSSEGGWCVSAACGKDMLGETLEIISAQLRRIYQGGITVDELEFAKSKRLKSLKMGLQTSSSWVGVHAADEIFNTKETIVDRMRKIESTTLADLKRVGEAYFVPGSCRGVFAGRITASEAVIPY